ncbi:hypothetical protein WA026_017437 [Henosepilachna vigintioctopunctata]|uniref:Uncharacterized protein n=1 Tax=Henosepilachna vigintioctopunctata TaxID=420089 RepID=A0AAW1VEZ2_9CUCU
MLPTISSMVLTIVPTVTKYSTQKSLFEIIFASKMGLGPAGHPGAGLPFFCPNGDPLSQPPPAHMGIPPYQLDAKAAGSMGEYGSPPPPQPQALSPAEWRRLGPLLAATVPPRIQQLAVYRHLEVTFRKESAGNTNPDKITKVRRNFVYLHPIAIADWILRTS